VSSNRINETVVDSTTSVTSFCTQNVCIRTTNTVDKDMEGYSIGTKDKEKIMFYIGVISYNF
jgi:hypothetical protein